MVVICAKDDAQKIMDNLAQNGETTMEIGYINKKEDGASVIINNTDTAWA